ncbi:hypothetical protein [Psychroserpens sp. SPM9]|uniref:hypothetical protein n=1 Tax=Psychroserpens sp. SPM9 TaxID=2975598 RepID=UPI0021A2C73F|nr:hypothetical protein [Psychroserpens sp. SPM9]MDG5492701.1 hypothetical protein [Psychroserpens sp. SPM9]
MYSVNGKILHQETQKGLSNLIVAFYNIHFQKWNEDTSQSFRLGSTFTNNKGEFRFEFENGLYDKYKSSDFALCVFTPDIGKSKSKIGQTSQQRLIHIAQFEVSKSGNTDTSIILIKPEQLSISEEKKALDSPKEIESLTEAQILKNTFETLEIQRVELNKVFKPILKKRSQIKTDAKNLVDKILQVSRFKNGQRERFVLPSEDSAPIMDSVIEEGLQKMEKMTPSMKGMQISVSSLSKVFPDLSGINISENPDALPDTINSGSIKNQILTEGASIGLYKENDFKSTCKKVSMLQSIESIEDGGSEEHSNLELDESIDSDTNTDPTVSPNVDPTDPKSKINEWLINEINRPINSNSTEIPSRPNDQDINGNLNKDIKVGPADTVAFHDFHSLKIAFKNVWTSSVDREFSKTLQDIYLETVIVAEEYGVDAQADFTEIEDLENLISVLNDKVAEIKTVSAIPSNLASWLGESITKWRYLSEEQRNKIKTLFWIYNITIEGKTVSDPLHLAVTVIITNRPLRKVVVEVIKQGDIPRRKVFANVPIYINHDKAFIWHPSEKPDYLREEALKLLRVKSDAPSIGRTEELLIGIKNKLAQGYRFDIFKPDTYNFGILATYRQKWEPLSYQVGDLVATIPLAPGEKRTFQKKQSKVTKRMQKEIENSISTRRFESNQTNRADAEIVNKAQHSTNFSMTTNGSISASFEGFTGEFSYGTQFSNNQSQESASTKRNFREAVRKASSEYKNEHKLEVSTEDTFSSEVTETGEISNPNNEITVTYLFYELQRRFKVSEELYKITPVILVAMDVPKPNQITETWLLEHDWILRRVLLDDSLDDALDYLTDSFAGDELGVEILRAQWETQMSLVKDLKSDFSTHTNLRNTLRQGFNSATASASVEAHREGAIDGLWESFFGDNIEEAQAKSKSEAADRLLQWAESDLALVDDKLRDALQGLQSTTSAYIEALRQRLNRRVSIDQLKIHVKQNILYYMQAIWAHEPADQRYFRIYDLPVKAPLTGGECKVLKDTLKPSILFDGFGNTKEEEYVSVQCPPPQQGTPKELQEIADLSRLIGFKGNYAIFPLTESNGITHFMMQDYVHDHYGLVDPDPKASDNSVEDLMDFNKCIDATHLNPNNPINRVNPEAVKGLLKDAIADGRFRSEEIVVPSGQLYIEALPGTHTVLEDFKLRHRAADVIKAHSEIRGIELENIRKASRIIDGQYDDPDTEKTVVIDSNNETDIDVDVN